MSIFTRCKHRNMDFQRIDLSLIQALNFSCPYCYLESGGEIQQVEREESLVLSNQYRCSPSPEPEGSVSDRLPDRIGKKYENFRQTVIRHFKKIMRKLHKEFKKFYPLENPAGNSKCMKKAKKVFGNLYTSDSHTQDHRVRVFDLLKYLYSSSIDYFKANHDHFRTCNNNYVTWFFSHLEIKNLYELHVSITPPTTYYKLLQITEEVTQHDLYNFLSEIAKSK